LKFDSVTVANTVTVLKTDPSWSLVVLAVCLGLIVLIGWAIKAGVVTKFMDFFLALKQNNESTAAIAETVTAIRKDQIVSNQKREELAVRVNMLHSEVDRINARIEQIGCANAPICPSRITPPVSEDDIEEAR